MLYYAWANDPAVRQNSFNQNPISIESHTDWFHRVVDSNDYLLLVFELNDIPVSQVRFSVQNKEALFNYSIAKDFCGKGLSAIIIEMAVKALARLKPLIEQVRAEVKKDNIASVKAFIKCGFAEHEFVDRLSFLKRL